MHHAPFSNVLYDRVQFSKMCPCIFEKLVRRESKGSTNDWIMRICLDGVTDCAAPPVNGAAVKRVVLRLSGGKHWRAPIRSNEITWSLRCVRFLEVGPVRWGGSIDRGLCCRHRPKPEPRPQDGESILSPECPLCSAAQSIPFMKC